MDTCYSAIDSRLAIYMRREGINQDELSDLVGLSNGQLGRKRRGVYDWKLSELIKISKIIGVELRELVVAP